MTGDKVLCVEGVKFIRQTSRARAFYGAGSTTVACLSYTLRNEGTSAVIINKDITICADGFLMMNAENIGCLGTYCADKINFKFDGTGVVSPYDKLVIIEIILDHPAFLDIQNA